MIVGTAGHIDHGKTSLVKAITGVDADRLKAEKERGITIELGFAYWPQDDGEVIGFVDVPGHERFVHTMLAGAHGIDRVLLVVAADDGIMPQTREHLEILAILGLDRGAVALTKIDAVEPDRVDEARDEIEAALAGGPLAGSPIFPLSSLTGQGLGALLDWLRAERKAVAAHDLQRSFRLAIDRSFVLQGAGVVAAGMILDGAIAVGDEVVLSPGGETARVRSLHAQNQRAERGVAGQRCALNLAGPKISKETVRRGDMLVAPGALAPTQRIDVELRVAPAASKGIGQWMPVRLHHASAEIGAHVVLLDDSKPAPGEIVRAQLALDAPIQAQALDRFVLRDVSASRTLAGGRFLDLRAPERKRRTPERLALLAGMAESDPVAALKAMFGATPAPVDLGAFAVDRGVELDRALAWSEAAGADAVSVGRITYAVERQRRAEVAAGVRAALEAFHAAQPDIGGMARERLRLEVAPRLPAQLFAILLRNFAAEGWLALDGNWLRLSSHAIEVTAAEEALWDAIEPRLGGESRFRPPRVRDIARELDADEEDVRKLLRRMARAGLVHEVAQDHYFLTPAVAEGVRMIDGVADGPQGWFTAGVLRDAFEAASGGVVGRKVAIQFLDFLDRLGVTIRRGDLRRINIHRRDLFESDRTGPDTELGRESSLVGRPDFKSGWGREPVPGGFDSHSLPPPSPPRRSGHG